MDLAFTIWALLESNKTTFAQTFFFIVVWDNVVIASYFFLILTHGHYGNRTFAADKQRFRLAQFLHHQQQTHNHGKTEKQKEYHESVGSTLEYIIALIEATDEPITMLGVHLTYERIIALLAILVAPFATLVVRLVNERCEIA